MDYAGQFVMVYPCHGMKGNQEWIYGPVSDIAFISYFNFSFGKKKHIISVHGFSLIIAQSLHIEHTREDLWTRELLCRLFKTKFIIIKMILLV